MTVSNLRLRRRSRTVLAVDWFYVQNGRQIGPVPVAQFDDLVCSGSILPETLVWREGLENWQPLASISLTPPSTSSALVPPPLPGSPRPGLTPCAECGAAFPQSEMIPFEGSWICAKCKPIFVQRVREGAPMAAGGAEAWQSGAAVVTLHGGKLPMRCVRCNGAVTGKPIERAFYWHREWVYLLLFIPLIYLIVYLLVRTRSTVSVPICDKCRQRRGLFIAGSWFLAAIGTALILIFVAGFTDSEELGLLAMMFLAVAMFLGFSKGVLLSTTRVNAHYIWMHGCGKEYRESLPEFPGSQYPR